MRNTLKYRAHESYGWGTVSLEGDGAEPPHQRFNLDLYSDGAVGRGQLYQAHPAALIAAARLILRFFEVPPEATRVQIDVDVRQRRAGARRPPPGPSRERASAAGEIADSGRAETAQIKKDLRRKL